MLSGIWRQRPSAGTTHGDSRHVPVAMIMTEDAKTEKYTAGGPCGAYIETPCKFDGLQGVIMFENLLKTFQKNFWLCDKNEPPVHY